MRVFHDTKLAESFVVRMEYELLDRQLSNTNTHGLRYGRRPFGITTGLKIDVDVIPPSGGDRG